MMRLTAQLKGFDALSLKVKYLVDAARRGLKESVPEAADLFVQEAKLQVPVVTGNLRDHIHAEQTVDAPERQVYAVTPADPAANDVGFDPPYARRIEYGFIGQDSLGRNFHQAAQPYMRPAYDAKQGEARAAIKEGVIGSLDDAMAQTAARRR